MVRIAVKDQGAGCPLKSAIDLGTLLSQPAPSRKHSGFRPWPLDRSGARHGLRWADRSVQRRHRATARPCRFILPVQPQPDPEQLEAPMTELKSVVLIVDDEAQIRRFLRAGFELEQFSVLEAENAEAGLRTATLRPVDLIVVDLGLPDLDGSAIVRARALLVDRSDHRAFGPIERRREGSAA